MEHARRYARYAHSNIPMSHHPTFSDGLWRRTGRLERRSHWHATMALRRSCPSNLWTTTWTAVQHVTCWATSGLMSARKGADLHAPNKSDVADHHIQVKCVGKTAASLGTPSRSQRFSGHPACRTKRSFHGPRSGVAGMAAGARVPCPGSRPFTCGRTGAKRPDEA